MQPITPVGLNLDSKPVSIMLKFLHIMLLSIAQKSLFMLNNMLISLSMPNAYVCVCTP